MSDPYILQTTFRLKRGKAATWTALNPVLDPGEPGFEIDTYKLKIGNGTTAWNNLEYFGGDFTVAADGKSITITDSKLALYGFADATSGQIPSKGSDGKVHWVVPTSITYEAGANIDITDGVISAVDTKYTAGTNITIDSNNVISATGSAAAEYIELEGWSESEGWHDGGTLTAAQAAILTASELNYIWMNGMHRLDFRYKDTNNNLATYSSNDGTKTHVIEVTLSTKAWRYAHTQLQAKLTAGNNITISGNTINATVRTYRPLKDSWKQSSTFGGVTLAEFCNAINADSSVSEGDAYCGNVNSNNFFEGVYLEDPYASLTSAEVAVQIMGPWGTGHVMLLTVTSSNNPPYFWQYTWVDGLASWVSWTDVRKLDSTSSSSELHALSLNGTEYKLASSYDDTAVKADITSLQNNKLNVLPKVDDPTDPGFGWEYHIPYNFEATPDAEKINVTLKTLTLDNKVTKMNFDKTLPAATTTTAGLMTAADKVALNGKQDKLTAGSNITIDANNVISATGGGSAVLTQELTAGYTIGGIEEGKVYAVGTSIEQILRDLFIKVTPAQNHLYYGVGKTIPTSVSGLTSVATTKETLLEDGYVWRNITLDEEYAFLAIDKSLGVSCYEIKQNGFALGYETVDLGDQILYYPSDPATDTGIRLEYAFE